MWRDIMIKEIRTKHKNENNNNNGKNKNKNQLIRIDLHS